MTKIPCLKATNEYGTKPIKIYIDDLEVIMMILVVGSSLMVMARRLNLLELIVRDALHLTQK
jgi:hypothetical protein